MNKLSSKGKIIIFSAALAIGILGIGGFMIHALLPKIPIKEYTAACLYLAVMDDEIGRNELEGNTVDGKEVVFPPRIEALQYKYHLFLEMNKKMTREEMNDEIKKTEQRLEESKQYIGQPKIEMETEWDRVE